MKSAYINVNASAVTNSSVIGVFRNSTHMFYLDNSGNGAWNGAGLTRRIHFGATGDLPVYGDWDNNGISEIGVFRPSTRTCLPGQQRERRVERSRTDRVYTFGVTGDLPVSGDWNNDGITEIGVFRPSAHTFYLDINGNGVWNGPLSRQGL